MIKVLFGVEGGPWREKTEDDDEIGRFAKDGDAMERVQALVRCERTLCRLHPYYYY